MISKLYPRYFQKSRVFLYPALGIRKSVPFLPHQTYIGWKDKYSFNDGKLILTYQNEMSKPEFKKFLSNVVLSNTYFLDILPSDDEKFVCAVFDLKPLGNDLHVFLDGKYSKFSKEHRNKIRDYYGYQSAEWSYMETFLYPDKHIPAYAELLGMDDETPLREVGELCDKFNPEKEMLDFTKLSEVTEESSTTTI